MVKNKKIVIAGGIAALLIVVGGGVTVALTYSSKKSGQLSLLSGPSDPYSSGSNQTSQPNNSAAATAGATAAAGSLNVSSASGANQLGQIGGNQTSQSGAGSSNTSAASSANSANSSFDPSTFAQYEKYKDASSAMFGDVVKGTGDELTDGKKAAVYYRGWLTNGTMFDQSRNGSDGKLQPFVFQLGSHQVITGWEQALAGMKVGGVRLVIVPPSVGYGATAQGSIPANSTLVFQVQLAAVQ